MSSDGQTLRDANTGSPPCVMPASLGHHSRSAGQRVARQEHDCDCALGKHASTVTLPWRKSRDSSGARSGVRSSRPPRVRHDLRWPTAGRARRPGVYGVQHGQWIRVTNGQTWLRVCRRGPSLGFWSDPIFHFAFAAFDRRVKRSQSIDVCSGGS